MKTLDLFGEQSNTKKDYHRAGYGSDWYAKNREYKDKKHAQWQKDNKDRLKAKRDIKNAGKMEAYKHLCELKRLGAEWAREIWLEDKDRQRVIAKEKAREYRNTYKRSHPRPTAKCREYRHARLKRDPMYKLKRHIGSAIGLHINNRGYTKSSTTQQILGIDYIGFKQHLESKFELWMSWDNYGLYEPGAINYGWDIDHIVPMATAKTEEDVIRLNHYTNLQPMCSYTNRYIKKDRIIKKRKAS